MATATTIAVAVAAAGSTATLRLTTTTTATATTAVSAAPPPPPSRSAPISPPPPPTPPSYLRVRRTLSRTLFGAVYECEQPDNDAAEPLRDYSPPLPPSSPLRRRGSLAVKTVSLAQVRRATRHVSPRRAVDDPWQEWRVAEKLRAHATAIHADANHDGRHVLCVHHQELLADGDTMVFVSEFCAGGDLFAFLEAQPAGAAAPATALAFTRQIARGLRFLHATLGVAHRDLSLENVLLRDGACKIADFALSTDAARRCCASAGKEYYMAPEVVAMAALDEGPESSYDPRAADVWSLGIVLFILLTGSPLLEVAVRGAHGFAALERHGVEPVLRAWGVRAALSDACAELLDAMLQVDPARRATLDAVLAHAALQEAP